MLFNVNFNVVFNVFVRVILSMIVATKLIIVLLSLFSQKIRLWSMSKNSNFQARIFIVANKYENITIITSNGFSVEGDSLGLIPYVETQSSAKYW